MFFKIEYANKTTLVAHPHFFILFGFSGNFPHFRSKTAMNYYEILPITKDAFAFAVSFARSADMRDELLTNSIARANARVKGSIYKRWENKCSHTEI
jgi:hypothetical protein